jgi:uncharacterized protein YndB with AHSA1/START domain
MPRIEVETLIAASPDDVWAAIEDIGSHVDWMADAEAIRFTTDQTAGVGTTFECDTKVGPFSLTDHMEITEWEPARTMGVRHTGLVTGEVRFTLSPEGSATRFAWAEGLRLPWWMGGPVGGAAGAPVLRRIWAGNLARLKTRVEGTQVEGPG